MTSIGPDEYMERMLAAHAAEDALRPADDVTASEPEPPSGPVDPSPILGLLGQAEKLCGVDLARLHAAAAA